MTLTKKSVELLAPAGTWDAFVAAIDAGADAVFCSSVKPDNAALAFSNSVVSAIILSL